MRHRRTIVLLGALALVAAACGDDAAPTTTTTTTAATTTTTSVPVTTSTTTTTLPPGGPALVADGDRNETVAAFQWLLVCGGYGNLTVDGNFGPATGSALATALAALGFATADDDAFAALSRNCAEARPLDDGTQTVIGNADPADPETYTIPLAFDSSLTLTVTPIEGVSLTVLGPDGGPLDPAQPDTTIWSIGTTGAYSIVVVPDLEPTTFTLLVEIGEDAEGVADWLLTTTGISYKGTKLSLGDSADPAITKIFEWLGHGVRGGGEFDTGWSAPGQEGIRGIAIEGFRFLFFGPNTTYPSRPKTLVRIRVFAPTTDKDGNPRPAFYVTTPQGIGPGNTLTDLLLVYPGVTKGKSGDEYHYRLTNSGGELCFYFGETNPTETSPIIEMSTECR